MLRLLYVATMYCVVAGIVICLLPLLPIILVAGLLIGLIVQGDETL